MNHYERKKTGRRSGQLKPSPEIALHYRVNLIKRMSGYSQIFQKIPTYYHFRRESGSFRFDMAFDICQERSIKAQQEAKNASLP